jgi:hypothetical protein
VQIHPLATYISQMVSLYTNEGSLSFEIFADVANSAVNAGRKGQTMQKSRTGRMVSEQGGRETRK